MLLACKDTCVGFGLWTAQRVCVCRKLTKYNCKNHIFIYCIFFLYLFNFLWLRACVRIFRLQRFYFHVIYFRFSDYSYSSNKMSPIICSNAISHQQLLRFACIFQKAISFNCKRILTHRQWRVCAYAYANTLQAWVTWIAAWPPVCLDRG